MFFIVFILKKKNTKSFQSHRGTWHNMALPLWAQTVRYLPHNAISTQPQHLSASDGLTNKTERER